MTPAELYAEVRGRITDLVTGLSETEAATPVPGCPLWTVHDVVAHLAGANADVLNGNLDGVTTDRWTAAQVEARRWTPLADILAEWHDLAPRIDTWIDAAPKLAWRMVVTDVVTHEQDVRGALRRPGGRDGEAYEVARKTYAVWLAKTIEERGLPGLRLAAEDWTFEAGSAPYTEVRTKESFEFLRALAGRRSRGQVLAYDWDGDPTPFLPVVSRFGALPEDDVLEG